MSVHPSSELPTLAARVQAARRFNRFYTTRIGLLRPGYLRSSFSLTEVRLLYELAHRQQPTAAELSRDLGLDPGYVSRVLQRFRRSRLVRMNPSADDGRRQMLGLTTTGQRVFAE